MFRRFRIVTRNENPGWNGRVLDPCRLDFYCDWGAEVPLWIDGSGMAYARSIPVSEGLRADLVAYQEWFEGMGPDEDLHHDDFRVAGQALVQRVRQELPEPWRVTDSWTARQ